MREGHLASLMLVADGSSRHQDYEAARANDDLAVEVAALRERVANQAASIEKLQLQLNDHRFTYKVELRTIEANLASFRKEFVRDFSEKGMSPAEVRRMGRRLNVTDKVVSLALQRLDTLL